MVRDPGAQPGEHEWCIAISNEQKEVGEFFIPINCAKACHSVNAIVVTTLKMNSHFFPMLLLPQSVRLEVRPFDSHDPDVRFVVRGLNIDEFEPPARGGAVTLRSKDSTGRDNSMDTHVE